LLDPEAALTRSVAEINVVREDVVVKAEGEDDRE